VDLHAILDATLSGEMPVKSECLPFSQIPHSTRLFLDFLAYSPSIRTFYPQSPHFGHWLKEEAGKLSYDATRRQRISVILERQNRAWGASDKTLANIGRLRAGACAVVTGQQVGFFGGPLFSIFKALTAVKLASDAQAAGVDCVPVFWLATEDHDLAEVDHTSVPSAEGGLERLSAPTQGQAGAPVGTIRLGAEIESVVDAAATLLGDTEVTQFLRESYAAGQSLGSAFARLFTRLFSDWGVILLDASDPELHGVAEPLYRRAVERAVEIDDALLDRGQALEASGYHQQVKVTPSSTLLFTFRNGARVPVHRRVNGSEIEFLVEEETIPQGRLLDTISATPHQFSANVLLRPVVQDYLLPTVTYTGGAAEVAYFAQVAVVYEALLGRVTPVIPRFSATLVEPKPQRLLERYGLVLPDLFHGPIPLRETLAERVLPADLQAAFDKANAGLESSLTAIREALGRLDKTLVDAATNAGEKIHYQMEQLRARAARAELRQTEVLNRHAEVLSKTLYPNRTLQEREIAGVYFLARHGLGLLHELYGSINSECLDHQVLQLQAE
jgi:bacillithiol biosynthesis cysteine-adding enzyme BshC